MSFEVSLVVSKCSKIVIYKQMHVYCYKQIVYINMVC